MTTYSRSPASSPRRATFSNPPRARSTPRVAPPSEKALRASLRCAPGACCVGGFGVCGVGAFGGSVGLAPGTVGGCGAVGAFGTLGCVAPLITPAGFIGFTTDLRACVCRLRGADDCGLMTVDGGRFGVVLGAFGVVTPGTSRVTTSCENMVRPPA